MLRNTRRMSASSVVVATLSGILIQVSRADTTERVSVSSANVQPSVASTASYVTPNGRWVVFTSGANNLVPNDTNNRGDVFVRDLQTNTTSRVSIPDPGTGNAEANENCFLGRKGVRYCSDDARFVVFVSSSNNLVNNDTNGDQPPFHISGDDIFVRDRDLDNDGIYDEAGVGNTKTVRVSVTTGESQYIEYSVGVGTYGGGVSDPSISANGRYVAFESQADNLGGGDGTSGSNIYWRDRDNDGNGIFDESGSTGGGVDRSITRLVSKVVSNNGNNGFSHDPAISGNGLHVAFVTASELLDYDTVQDSDSNQREDVYVRKMSDANTNKSQRVSLRFNDTQTTDSGSGSPSISYDGRYVAFTSFSHQLIATGTDTNDTTDVFVRDRGAGGGSESYIVSLGSTARVSLGVFSFLSTNAFQELSMPSTEPFISSDGRYVAFNNAGIDINCGILGCTDTLGHDNVYVRDTFTGSESTTRMSRTAGGAVVNGDSTFGAISDDASVTSFQSVGTNVVTPDGNGAISDVYAHSVTLSAFGWRSVRTHTGNGALPIYLNSTASGNGNGGPTTETRLNGIQRIEVDLGSEAQLVNPGAVSVIGRTTVGGVMGVPVNYSGTAGVSMSPDGRTLILTFAAGALPDETCYTIDVNGAVANNVGGIAGDSNVNVRSLRADTTSSGIVNLSDALRAKALIGSAVSTYPDVDINLSGGNVTSADALAAKARVTSPPHRVICP